MGLSNTQLSKILETASEAARLAGQRAMDELSYLRTSVKNHSELVTQADPICQKLIIDRIKAVFPDDGFIAEEGTDGKMLFCPPRTDAAVWWVIDPIDGTNNYANGLLCFCVSIAAFYDGTPVAAAIYEPSADCMFTAAQNTDCLLNQSRISVNQQDINKFASFGIDSQIDPATNTAAAELMRQTRFRCLGSTAMHLAYVAKGSLIGAVSASAKLWDIAAGALLIERAGGKMTYLDGKSIFPIDLKQYAGGSFQTLSSNTKLYSTLLQLFSQ